MTPKTRALFEQVMAEFDFVEDCHENWYSDDIFPDLVIFENYKGEIGASTLNGEHYQGIHILKTFKDAKSLRSFFAKILAERIMDA